MDNRISLFDGHLRVNNVELAADAPLVSDVMDNATHAALDTFEGPGVSLDLRAAANAVAASGGVEVKVTAPESTSGVTVGLAVRGGVSAALDMSSVAEAMRKVTPLITQATALQSDARDIVTRGQALMGKLNGPEMQALRDASAKNDFVGVITAAQPLLGDLKAAIKLLDDSASALQKVDALMQDAQTLQGTMQARAAVRGAAEVDVPMSKRVASAESGDSKATLSVGATLGVIVPVSNPVALPEVPGMRPLTSAMVALQAIATVQFRGFDELRAATRDLLKLTQDAAVQGRQIDRDPSLLLDTTAAQQRLDALTARAEAVSTRLGAAVSGAGVDVDFGARATEATGPGVGLRELGAKLDLSRGNFDANVALTLRNLVGALPGRYTSYGVADGGLQVLSEGAANVFSLFYPASESIDGRLRFKASERVQLEARAGVSATLSGESAAGYGSIFAHLGPVIAGAGVVTPISHDPKPVFSGSLGLSAKGFAVQASGGVSSQATGSFQLSLARQF